VAELLRVEGLAETEHALEQVADDLKPGHGVDATAGSAVADVLAPMLAAAAEASGVPVAARVARSIRVQSGTRPDTTGASRTAYPRRKPHREGTRAEQAPGSG